MQDISLGTASSSPAEITPACSAVLFSAQEPSFARELWGIPHSLTPGTIDDLRVAKNEPSASFIQLSWSSQDPALTATRYDVVRGVLSTLRAGGFPGGATCAADDMPETPYAEPTLACGESPGDGCWYLIRAQNACGTASYGVTALDTSGPCP